MQILKGTVATSFGQSTSFGNEDSSSSSSKHVARNWRVLAPRNVKISRNLEKRGFRIHAALEDGTEEQKIVERAPDNGAATPGAGHVGKRLLASPGGGGGGSSSSGGGGGSRPGLFRTPRSGGVQSATSSHGLPHPALAVRNLMEQARYAHLCTIMSRMHHRRLGYPFGTLVDFAPDTFGHPIFSLSPLEIHTRNLLADPRCTLVVQVPGFSGLGNARVTLFGDVYPLPPAKQEWAHKHYSRKHQHGASQQWGNFYYYQMQRISDIYFVGGFGTVAWVDVEEFEQVQPDVIAANGDEETLKALNAIFSKSLTDMISMECSEEMDEAALISIDSKGIDIRVRQGTKFNVQRLAFEGGHAVETLDQAKAALDKLLNYHSKKP